MYPQTVGNEKPNNKDKPSGSCTGDGASGSYEPGRPGGFLFSTGLRKGKILLIRLHLRPLIRTSDTNT